MTTTRDDPTTAAALAEVGEASAFPGLRGLRWWGVLLLALVLTAGGVAVDVLREGTLGVVFLAAYPGGCVLAAVLAQRRDIFVPMVQPPLLLAVSVPVAIAATGTLPASGGMVSTALAVGAPLINGFPAMAVTTVVCVLIGLVRMRVQRWRPADAAARREPVRSGPAAAPTREAPPRDRDRDRGRDRERAREERDRRDAAERADAAERREQAERERRRAQERARAERDREMAERDRAARERREQDLAERERARREREAKPSSKSGSKKRPKPRDDRPDDRPRPDDRERLARGAAEVPPGPTPRRSPLKGAGRDEAPARDQAPREPAPREPAPREPAPREPAPRDARSREDRMREERLREERRGGGRPPGVHPVRERPPERPPR
ncbi:DUF6542 domain-containing protein [Actinomycetospora sp. CA-084318]|uniref:DUF6542 domain-containing protein n=1 Tax=Actinomycetospora sp. CA-084318 TaxID=3239892 RepID=UPI003D953B8F